MTTHISMPDRPYSYFHQDIVKGWWVAATRAEWLHAVAIGEARPKAPESWLVQQELEGRDRRTAAIIWSRNYDGPRRSLIWDMATDEDFRTLGYLE